ncbi:hypothetical protein [Streptomyces montanisoli]|uniref:DUF11 domain-containing protein n=1 Tax=Streptomyces montanisoli TaxID=2798581 RepID=A0A940M6I7_9ACTN|nr:hypothetical protein [Streptomyces montanisoli]MBP0457095.1 hypothetical protein [Streptomyces montanisoli]
MRHSVVRRALSVAAVLTVSAVGALSGVGPAAAATPSSDPVLTLEGLSPVAVAPAGTPGVAKTVQPNFSFRTSARKVNAPITLKIDISRLSRIARVSFSGNCTVDAGIATCEDQVTSDHLTPRSGLWGVTQMTVRARAGAALGAVADYGVSGTAEGATVVGATGSVEIGGPAFSQKKLVDHTGLEVGSTVREPVRFTNIGDRPASATEILLAASPGATFTKHYANCRYSMRPRDAEADLALCTIPGDVPVGQTDALSEPVRLRMRSTAYSTYLDTLVAPAGDPAFGAYVTGRTWKQGTGSALGLKVVKAGTASAAPAGAVSLPETGTHSDYRIAALSAVNTADFAVTGGSAHAAQGDTVTLTFGMVNNGPATIFDRSGSPMGVEMTPPPGTTVVSASRGCEPSVYDDPEVTAHGPYWCEASYLVPDGKRYDFSVTLRVDQVVPGALGSVSMGWGEEGGAGGRPAFDPDAADDVASLVLN